VSSVSLFQR